MMEEEEGGEAEAHNGRRTQNGGFGTPKQKQLRFSPKIIGFYFDISDKFHPVARAYYPKLADTGPKWTAICPLRALKLLWIYGLLQASPLKSLPHEKKYS